MLRNLDAVSTAILQRTGAAARFVPSANSLAAAYDPVRTELGQGFKPQAEVLQDFADRTASLQAILDVAPSSLSALRQGLAQAQPLLEQTAGFARATIALTQPAPAALRAATSLLKEGVPSLQRTEPLLTAIDRAVTPTTSLLTTFDPVISPTIRVLRNQIRPLSYLASRQCDFLKETTNWRSAMSWGVPIGSDPLSHLTDGEPGLGPNVNSFRVIALPETTSETLNADAPGNFVHGSDPYPAPVRGARPGAPMKPRFRNFLDPVSSRTVEHPTRNGAILVVISLLVIVGAVSHRLPLIDSQSGYTVRADFAFVNNVNSRTPVRVRGVDVGVVTGVGPGPDPQRASELKMLITDSGLVVHSDAGAAIRWRTVLGGPMYIDLNPGSPDAPKLGDGAIPVSRTSSQTEFDDVLRIYNGGTDQAQREMLKGLSQGFGAPRATGTTIGSLQDLTTIGQGLKPYSGTIPGDLSRLVANTAQTAQALGTNVTDLQTLVSSADQTLGAIDQQRVALGQMLSLSPGTLDSTEVTMNRIRTTLNHLDPLVTHLLPGAVQIAPASHALQPALDRANSLLIEAQPLLHDARPTLSEPARGQHRRRAGADGARADAQPAQLEHPPVARPARQRHAGDQLRVDRADLLGPRQGRRGVRRGRLPAAPLDPARDGQPARRGDPDPAPRAPSRINVTASRTPASGPTARRWPRSWPVACSEEPQ